MNIPETISLTHVYETWRLLTDEMETALEEVIHATESWNCIKYIVPVC